jgi:hypothetical protein
MNCKSHFVHAAASSLYLRGCARDSCVLARWCVRDHAKRWLRPFTEFTPTFACPARVHTHTHLRPVVANTNTQSASTRLTSTHTHHLDHVCDISLAMDMLTRFSVAHVPQNQRNALCCTPVPFVVHTLTFHSLLPFISPSSTPGPCLSCCRSLQPPAHFRHTSKQGKHNGCRSDRSMGLEQAEGFCRGWAQGSSHTGVSAGIAASALSFPCLAISAACASHVVYCSAAADLSKASRTQSHRSEWVLEQQVLSHSPA